MFNVGSAALFRSRGSGSFPSIGFWSPTHVPTTSSECGSAGRGAGAARVGSEDVVDPSFRRCFLPHATFSIRSGEERGAPVTPALFWPLRKVDSGAMALLATYPRSQESPHAPDVNFWRGPRSRGFIRRNRVSLPHITAPVLRLTASDQSAE